MLCLGNALDLQRTLGAKRETDYNDGDEDDFDKEGLSESKYEKQFFDGL